MSYSIKKLTFPTEYDMIIRVIKMEFYAIKSDWQEKQGFELNRSDIGDNCIFVHFRTPVTVYFGEEAVRVSPGGCILFESFLPQHFASPECVLLHDWFHADTKSCRALAKQYGIECNKVYYPADGNAVTGIIADIELEYLRCEMFYKEVSDNLAKKLFVLLARADKSSVSDLSAMRYKEQFLGIRAAVHANYTADCRVEDMARLANMSMSRFFTIYKQIFGISPQKDLNNSRLQRAKIMLSNSSYSVEKISELVGFNNQYHFIRRFKKSTGMSPGQYRKMQKN